MTNIEKHNYQPKHLSIEELVHSNGNWTVVYCYNRFGSNVMMLLPTFEVDEDEAEVNKSCVELAASSYEEARLIEQYIKVHPGHPFLVMADTMMGCNQIMCGLLDEYHNDFEQFIRDSDEFDRWRRAVHKIHNTDGAEISAYYDGWESFADK